MLPDGWTIQTVGSLFNIQLGKMLNQVAKTQNPQYEYLGNTNVKWGYFNLSELKTMFFSEKEKEKFSLHNGDIIMCEGGEVGRCAIWRVGKKEIFYQKALHRLRPMDNIIPEFFQNYMEYIAGTRLLDNLTTQSSISHLTQEKLLELTVKTPPLPEQQKIAQILSTWDNAIEKLEALITAKKKRKKALMQQLLTGKKRFSGFDGEWRLTAISEIINESKIPSILNDPKKRLTVRLNFNGIKHREFRGTESLSSTAHFIRKSGQFIYGKQNFHKGAFGIIPTKFDFYETSQDIPSFDFLNGCNSNWFYYYCSQSCFYIGIENLMTGTGSKRLNPKVFQKIKLLLPSTKEQQKIASVLSTADKEIETHQKQLEAFKQQKKGLMQQLLTGKKRVKPDNGKPHV